MNISELQTEFGDIVYDDTLGWMFNNKPVKYYRGLSEMKNVYVQYIWEDDEIDLFNICPKS